MTDEITAMQLQTDEDGKLRIMNIPKHMHMTREVLSERCVYCRVVITDDYGIKATYRVTGTTASGHLDLVLIENDD